MNPIAFITLALACAGLAATLLSMGIYNLRERYTVGGCVAVFTAVIALAVGVILLQEAWESYSWIRLNENFPVILEQQQPVKQYKPSDI